MTESHPLTARAEMTDSHPLTARARWQHAAWAGLQQRRICLALKPQEGVLFRTGRILAHRLANVVPFVPCLITNAHCSTVQLPRGPWPELEVRGGSSWSRCAKLYIGCIFAETISGWDDERAGREQDDLSNSGLSFSAFLRRTQMFTVSWPFQAAVWFWSTNPNLEFRMDTYFWATLPFHCLSCSIFRVEGAFTNVLLYFLLLRPLDIVCTSAVASRLTVWEAARQILVQPSGLRKLLTQGWLSEFRLMAQYALGGILSDVWPHWRVLLESAQAFVKERKLLAMVVPVCLASAPLAMSRSQIAKALWHMAAFVVPPVLTTALGACAHHVFGDPPIAQQRLQIRAQREVLEERDNSRAQMALLLDEVAQEHLTVAVDLPEDLWRGFRAQSLRSFSKTVSRSISKEIIARSMSSSRGLSLTPPPAAGQVFVVGDAIKVISIIAYRGHMPISRGSTGTITDTNEEGDVLIDFNGESRWVLRKDFRNLERQGAEESLDGIWITTGKKLCTISGSLITWPNGSTSEFMTVADGKYKLILKGQEYRAHRRGQTLVWSHGDAWTKQVFDGPRIIYVSGYLGPEMTAVNGAYTLVRFYNERPAYKNEGFTFFVVYEADGTWNLKTKLDPDSGSGCFAYVKDSANYPSSITAVWHVFDSNNDSFCEMPRLSITPNENAFIRRMHLLNILSQEPDGPLCQSAEQFTLVVRRAALVESSIAAVEVATPAQLLAHSFTVHFRGELGLDYGGLFREWFDLLGQELATGRTLAQSPHIASASSQSTSQQLANLWSQAPDDTLLPSADTQGDNSPVGAQNNLAHFVHFVAVGRLLAMSVRHDVPLGLPLSTLVYKCLLRKSISAQDLRQLDPEFFKQRLQRLLTPGGADAIAEMLGEPLTFMSAGTDWRPDPSPLVAGGETRIVTEENKHEYAVLLCEDYLIGGIRKEMQALLRGFWELVPLEALQEAKLTEWDIQRLVEAGPPLDAQSLQDVARCDPSPECSQFVWFFETLKEFDVEARAKVLQFTTGSSRLPPEGPKALQPPFTIVINPELDERLLPTSHTCVNMINIPSYSTQEMLRERLLQAVAADAGFGFM